MNLLDDDWLVVSTHLKNISQMGNLPHIEVKINNVWNHHLDDKFLLEKPVILVTPTYRNMLAADFPFFISWEFKGIPAMTPPQEIRPY